MKTRINLLTNVKNDGRTTVNRRSTDGQSQRHYTLGLMKYAAIITLLLTLACGNMWGTDETFTFSWTSVGTAGYSYSQAGPTGGALLTNNAIYFLSNEGPKVDASKLNPYRVGFVFKPTANVSLKIKCSAGSSARTIQSIKIDEEIDARFYSLCKDAVGASKTVMKYALDNATSDDKAFYATVGILKVSKGVYSVAGDAKSASGQTAQASLYTARVDANNISVPANGNNEVTLNTGDPAADYTFQAGTCYRVYTEVSSSTGSQVVSFTFTAAGGVTQPSFSPATGSSLVKSTGTVTLTSSGNTVYYKWSQTDNQYASSAGATLAAAADGSGPSPVNATAPSTAGTWYLYAVAKNGGDYSDVVKATYTITNPTHTLTWNLDGGTATGGTAAGAVAEGATLTAPTVTKVGYDFAGWSPTVPATMPAADAIYTATWTKVYASGTYNFVNQGDGSVTWGSSHTVTLPAGTKTTVPAGSRVDNIFFSTALDIEYEKGAEAGTGYKGWKIKQSGKLAFYVENDCDVIVTNGIINGMKIHYYNQSNVETNTNLTSIAGTREETAHVKGGTLFEIVSTTTSTNTLKEIRVSSSCTAPNHVDISGDWDKFGGETISLTATAYSSAGTGSPIADGNITGWQWQKLVGSTWTNVTNGTAAGVTTSGATTKNLQISNCGQGNSGKYRCVVSTGATCSTASATATDGSEGYVVKVYALECYTGGSTVYNFTRDGNNQRGSVSIALTASTGYEFKIHADKYYGNNGTINFDENNWTFTAAGNNVTVNSGLGGTFTFTIDYSSNGDVPVLAVTYPRKRIYLSPGVWDADGAKFAYYYFHKTGDDTDAEGWTDFLTANDCGRFADIPQWNGVKVIAGRINGALDAPEFGDGKCWNQTGDLTVTSNDYIVVNNWDNITYNSTYSTPTYTISYNAGTGGSCSKSNETKTCGVAFTLPSSAVFERTGYTQTGWTTSDGGAQEYALGGTYTTNEDKTFYPVWSCITPEAPAAAKITATDGCSGSAGATFSADDSGIPSYVTWYWQTASDGTSTSYPVSSDYETASTAGSKTMYVRAKNTACDSWSTATSKSATVKTAATIAWNTAPADGTAGGSMTASVTTNYSDGVAYSVQSATPAGCVTVGASTGVISYVAAGSATIRATVTGAGDYCSSAYVDQAVTVTAAAVLTALDCNTLYKVEDMVPASITLTGDGQYGAGLSANTKFEVIGDPAEAGNTGGTPEMKNEAASFAEQSFTARMYLKGASNTTGSGTTFVPTSRAVKFIVSESGTLDIYAHRVDRLYLKKVGDSGTTQLGTSTSGSGSMVSHNVTAGTYYIYATGNSTCVYGVRLNCCTTPAAPTAFSAGSITSTGATFSITDAGDAASYDIYYSESSTAPTAVTAATTTSDSKTKAVTGLTASTTYYAWVRSVCDADHKSAWVALSGSSFTTTSTPAELTAIEANVLYQAADMANITFTGSDQWFAGLSTNAKFKVYGNGTSTSAFGKNENHNVTDDIDTKNFTSALYITAADNTSSSSDPTKGAIEFITPSTAGTLYLYLNTSSSSLSIKKKGTSTSTSLSGGAYKKIAVEANTHYFINGAGSNRGLYGIKFIADVTAPTFVSSVPANGATGVATSGTIVLTFSEALGSVEASKFTLTGATKGAVSIDGSDATKVNIAYSGAEEEETVTLATAAAAVSDLAGNALAAALSDISFTTAAAAPAGDCEELFAGRATSTSVFTPSAGSATFNLSSGNSFSAGGYSYSVKPNSSNAIVASPKAGGSFAAGDSLIVVIYNNESGSKTMGFRLGSGTYSTSVGSKKLHIFRQVLVASDISAGKVTFNRQSSDDRWVEIIIKHCGLLPSCTTPVLPTLTAKTVCEGGDADAAWNAAITNSGSLVSGETVAYSWVKKGGSTPVSSVATYQPTDVTEAMAGTYVVTATVSADGKASKSASQEVDLAVTEGTEAPTVTQSTTPVYEDNSVTLTATATTGATYTWHTCNADGTGESSAISGATTNAYTIASAPAAGTHYYKVKVTGDGTHTCGNAETVYALTVSEAAGGDCETEFWFAKAADKPEGATAATHISGTPSGSSSASYTATIDGNNYTITGQTGQKTGNVTITVPEDYEGTLYVVVQGSSSRTITLSKGGVQVGQETPANSTWGTFTFSNLDAGTYTLVSSGNIGWGILALKLCSAVACSDPEVTASADNTTACAGTSVTFTAANAHASATYQWQKLNGTWTNISDETASTYTIASVVAGDAGKYRVIASHDCNRTSNEVTLSVPSAPDFGSTVPASVSVMQTIALSINTVEATDAVKYRWYKSADATWDAGDVEIGTNKELIKAYDSEAISSPSYYIFCRAQNACGITTSTAIAVNVTAYVEEDCATRGNEGDAAFGFEYSASQATYNSTACWSMNDNSKKLIYAAPTGKYFKTMKVTIASSSASKASYNWSTNGGTTFTEGAISSINTTLTEKTIDVSAHGNVNALQIGRNLDGKGESSGTLYVSKICFEYTDACTATTVTPSTSSVDYEMGGAWSNPTFTLSVAGTLTYSSSNEDIASVDDDGTVTFNGEAGTVTITASYAGGTISETEYCASSGSYTINVSCTGGAPKVVASGTTVGCSSSITLQAKQSDGTSDFADGTYQWFRNGEEIDGATNSSYTATQAGTYTVERTNASDCTTPSTNSAIVTSETTEPEVERLVPFQYYHVDKTYSDQMKMRHLFAVKNSGKLDGKSFKMYVSRNGAAATDVTSSNALVVWPNGDGHVDTVMVDLNKLSGKYSEDDELVFTCKAIDCSGNVSDVYKETITMNVIGATPTLALICSGSSKAGGTRKTGELTVGGDFLTGYNVADLCQQTGNTSFDANTEWGLYTDLKANYIVTPVNGYAVFNKLNYEPFDILLLTDYPKASKSDAAANVLDDMAALCDYRPMLSFKTHMVAKSPSKWAEKGFTTSPVVTKADGRLNLNIVCYAHPMFEGLKTGDDVYTDVENTSAPLVYTMLSGTGYESNKGMQGFEIAAAENFVTIGLTHYNGTITKDSPDPGEVEWTPLTEDRMLVTVAERQANPEARFILFSLNCGAQSKLTDRGEQVVLACLNYLLGTAEGTIDPADCSFTFDNGDNNEHNDAWYASNCPLCTGTKGDGKWTTAANWGPDYRLLPGEFTSVRIKKPVEVDDTHAHVMEVRLIDEGSIVIPAGKALDVKSTIRRMDGSEIYPTDVNDIHIGSASTGNGTLIFNNNSGDTKARVDMYSTALADVANMSAATSTWQYIGTPHNDVAIATYNYYDSWLYQYSGSGWEVIPNGGPLVPFRGYCVTHPAAPVVFDMVGTLVATTSQDIAIPAGYTVIANSWVAPIDINAITDDDMEGISDKSIYFFNTGSDADGNHGTGTEAGTYRTTPIHSASYTGDWQIPSMQGFYISTETAGTLHLDYDRHVRPTGSRSVVSNQMYAPRRAAAESGEPAVLKIFARGSRYQDKLVVLEREDFTRGYDSGWDGEAWGGGTLSPMVYVTGDGREDAVSAIPEFEGTVVAFKAGEDSEYRFEFIYDGDESLYLFDTENNTYTQIMTGNAYYFTTTDKAAHSRFILTRKAPQIATGVEPTSDGEGAKARKLLIEDKMYILLNGMLYDATGKVVK